MKWLASLIILLICLGANNASAQDTDILHDEELVGIPAVIIDTAAAAATTGQIANTDTNVTGTESVPTIEVNNLENLVKSPQGLFTVAALLVWVLLELLKGLFPVFADAAAGIKWSVSILSGIAFGVLFALFGGVTYSWWVGGISGALGAASVSSVRAFGLWTRGRSRKFWRHLRGGGMIAGLCLILPLFGCAGSLTGLTTQQSIWTSGSLNIAACLGKCGVGAFADNIVATSSDISIDTTGMSDDAQACLMSCATSVGVPTIIESIEQAFAGNTRGVDNPTLRRVLHVTKITKE